jgi:hypothetical protein
MLFAPQVARTSVNSNNLDIKKHDSPKSLYFLRVVFFQNFFLGRTK